MIPHKHVLIISDIEGSSCCWNYEMSSFMTADWPEACVGMSLDVNTVCQALFNAGVETITVKDFHRTGYNLFPELIDHRARLIHGYRAGPVPGIGDPEPATAVLMIGMHAPSGSDGFLAHTMTSRIASLTLNGELLSEAELFSASLAPYGISPLFFSGCPTACRMAQEKIEGLHCFPIEKTSDMDRCNAESWRQALANEAVKAISSQAGIPYNPAGPFKVVIEMRDGPKTAEKLARRWGHPFEDSNIFIEQDDIHSLYHDLARLCYLTPLVEKALPLALSLFNTRGKLGLWWARRHYYRNPGQHPNS